MGEALKMLSQYFIQPTSRVGISMKSIACIQDAYSGAKFASLYSIAAFA